MNSGGGLGRKAEDLRGRHGRLLVTGRAPIRYGITEWECVCDCGRAKVVRAEHLRSGRTQSCGCLRLERLRAAIVVHGERGSEEYKTWLNMVQRCTNAGLRYFKNYGGRGIQVCERWRSFANFLSDMGRRPGPRMTIERIDNDAGYEPGNCRWASRKEQNRNKRTNVIVTAFGRSMTLVEWSELTGIPYFTLHARRRRSWTPERMVTP